MNLNLTPIRETGDSRNGTLHATYKEIVAKVGEPNVTDMDDQEKVKASWGFQDDKGNKGFIWCYKWYGLLYTCKEWSIDGFSLVKEIFGDKAIE